MYHRHRKPDLMIVLALFVILGVVVTTTLQAHGPARSGTPIAVSATHTVHTAHTAPIMDDRG
jgi:hypothetical protein